MKLCSEFWTYGNRAGLRGGLFCDMRGLYMVGGPVRIDKSEGTGGDFIDGDNVLSNLW